MKHTIKLVTKYLAHSSNLADLEVQIYEANANLFSVFFDMENLFHEYGLHYKLGLRGYVADELLAIHSQKNGIPQDSPLSGTFFLGINDITNIIQPPLQTILFSDHLSIHLRSSNPNRALHILQAALHKIHSWLSTRFRISTLKAKFIIFQKPRSKPITLSHPLVIANNNIPQGDEIEVLGLLFQFRHS